MYSGGASESFLGEVLSKRPRDSYILGTKLRFPVGDGTGEGPSAEQVHKQIDLSLGWVQTDYVDLYQCHRDDPYTPLEETMEALTDVVRMGKVRYIGFSEFTPELIQRSLELTRERGFEKFVSSQPEYSLLWRAPEGEVIPLCRENEISQIVWSPLAEGVLTGKYRPGSPPPAETRATSERMSATIGRRLDDATLEQVDRLRSIAERLGYTTAQVALAWILREDNVAVPISAPRGPIKSARTPPRRTSISMRKPSPRSRPSSSEGRGQSAVTRDSSSPSEPMRARTRARGPALGAFQVHRGSLFVGILHYAGSRALRQRGTPRS